jgi:hypothetical protein
LCLFAAAITLLNPALPVASAEDKPSRRAADEISIDWSFTATTLKANGRVSAGGQTNGDKLRWAQITVNLDEMKYADTFRRVLAFYADRCGADFGYDPKRMNVGVKGETKKGRYIFSDVRNDPRETSFVFNAPDHTVTGLIRPGTEKEEVEVLITIVIR